MANPKIIVIIPTRERCDVLRFALASVLQQDYAELQIIISDNFSNDGTNDFVKSCNDPRITYINTGRRVSMSENWEFALEHAGAGWITFLGDDDGLPLGAIHKIASIIRETGAKVIRSRFCIFDWPGVNGRPYSRLIVPKTSGLETRDTGTWLKRCLSGKAKYTELPMIYNGGFIHSSVLQKIKAMNNKYFSSCTPDVYSAVAIASVADKFLFSHTPLSISGTSVHSTGSSFNSASSSRNLLPAIKFSSEQNIPFHQEMPLCNDGSYPKSLHALTYECYLQTKLLRGNADLTTHEKQLKIILALDSHIGDAILDWGKSFADMHNIDFNATYRNAKIISPALRSKIISKKLILALQSIIVNGQSLPLTNVHQASVAATTLLNHPSSLNSISTLVRDHIVRY